MCSATTRAVSFAIPALAVLAVRPVPVHLIRAYITAQISSNQIMLARFPLRNAPTRNPLTDLHHCVKALPRGRVLPLMPDANGLSIQRRT